MSFRGFCSKIFTVWNHLFLLGSVGRKRLAEMRKKNNAGARKSVRVDRAEDEQNSAKTTLSKQDKLECELIEIIFAAPKTIEVIRQEVGGADFQNHQFRQLFEACCDLAEHGLSPTYERVTSTVEDFDLKNWAAKIDELSRQKQIAQKLDEEDVPSGDAAIPTLLQHTLHHLKWRRHEESNEQLKGQMAQLQNVSTELDHDVKAHLRQLSEFHRKRATKKTIN